AGSIVDPSDSRKLKQSGLIHIVTASGLQVFVLAFLLFQLLRFLPASRPAQIVVVASILCLYALAAGLNPAVVRASVMSILALSAHLFRREPDALSSLALAGIGYLLWNPHAVYSPGFALSFVTVACVALFFKRAPIDLSDRRQLLLRWSNDFLCLSWVICVAALPLSAYYFGVVSAVSVLSNLLVAWCTPLLVGGSILTYVLSTVLPTVAAAISSHILGPLSQWVLTVLDWTGGEGSSLNLPPFSGYWLVLFYGALILTVRRRVVQP
ncbi:MAG: ComEC/Rec2 family competence protein, partial [Fimbriimonas sp.]|nr:ComEC/Rec2 family competence protein [Fimbriimonas sp.]